MSSGLEQYYRSASKRYDQLRFDGDTEVERHIDWFIGKNCPTDQTLLDIGCGTGRYSAELVRRGFDVTGLDRSSSQLSEAKKKGIKAIQGSAEALPFAPSSFDVVAFVMMLHQLNESQTTEAFSEATRVAKSNGRIWIKTCSHEDLRARPFTDLFPDTFEINRKRYRPIEDLIKILESHQVTLVRSETLIDRYELSGHEIIERTRMRHNSTLHLLSDNAFFDGLEGLKRRYQPDQKYDLSHRHTLLEFRRQ